MERFETVMAELKRLEEEYKIADKKVEDYWEGEGEDEDYAGLVRAYREARYAYEEYLNKAQEEMDKEGKEATMREETEAAMWYAVEMDRDDNDWGTGSYDLDEAVRMAKRMGAKLIAVIEMGSDPVCVEEIEVE